MDQVKVYTVNGAPAGSSSSLPDWLTRKRSSAKRSKREHVEGTIELIQGFEFPEASNRIKITKDGHHAIATGTYKPQIRVWDLEQLTLKFERHTDAENVDFVMLSDDWTKSIHLQNDRTIELHTQGGFHYRTRIPKFGRALAYHFPSCNALFGASGNEVYRLDLDQGRFMAPLELEDDEQDILGVNVIDINPAHQLWSFGLDSANGAVQFWDPRSRSKVATLRLPTSRLIPTGSTGTGVSITALSSRPDGLSYAIGTSTGHTLLYDIRAANPFALKDQGYGLPVHRVIWLQGVGEGHLLLSADKKVVKIWDRHTPSKNFCSLTPPTDLNDMTHIPGSGLLLSANEGIQMNSYFIPQLGPAPRWARFLENITEEMEGQNTRTVYQDFKFVDREELKRLGLDHLIGTTTLKPYMHGYFLSLKLYDTARLIANPFVYAEHREKLVKEKMDKLAETRIRAPKNNPNKKKVEVNQRLAEKILRDEERAAKRRVKKRKAGEEDGQEEEGDHMDVDPTTEKTEPPPSQPGESLLSDPRFSRIFSDPDFEVDETSREYALLNPSAWVQKQNLRTRLDEGSSEEDQSRGSDDDDEEDAGEQEEEDGDSSDDSGDLRPQRYQRQRQAPKVNMVSMRPTAASGSSTSRSRGDKNATFGQRRRTSSSKQFDTRQGDGGGVEMSWVPGAVSASDHSSSRQKRNQKHRGKDGREVFGASLSRGGPSHFDGGGTDKKGGRTHRRSGMRSGSKNVFRRMGT